MLNSHGEAVAQLGDLLNSLNKVFNQIGTKLGNRNNPKLRFKMFRSLDIGKELTKNKVVSQL